MEKKIEPALRNAKNLVHVRTELFKLFKATKNGVGTKIGYVAGIINSDGPKYFQRNRKRLVNHAAKLKKLHNFPMFTAVDVFPEEIYKNLEEWKLSFEKREAKVRNFWRKILKSGHVTDIFMTPRWDKSKGATDEHKTAKEVGLRIHYIGGALKSSSWPLTGKFGYAKIANTRQGKREIIIYDKKLSRSKSSS